MFCGCANARGGESPNSCICEICMAHPGTLPAPNATAIAWAVKTALALHGTITPESIFERKHYFYPDLPKGYQISQHQHPIATGGFIRYDCACKTKDKKNCEQCTIQIERLQLEEDTAKLIHTKDGSTLIDFNRAGTPLLEIISAPDIRHPADARSYLQELKETVKAIGVSDADMEKGQLRCDANISIRRAGDTHLNTKIEVKNLNSFRAVERALEYEAKRLSALMEEGKYPMVQETRGWDDAKGMTTLQRVKEQAEDYRYFPDPDIPPLLFTPDYINEMRSKIPELPHEKRKRFIFQYNFDYQEAFDLVADPILADYSEQVLSELVAWLSSMPGEGTEEEILQKHGRTLARLVYGWLTSKLGGILTERNESYAELKITPEDFAEFLTLIFTRTISSTIAQDLLVQMAATGHDPHELLEASGGGQVQDISVIAQEAQNAINANPHVVEEYRKGKEGVIMYLVGQVMKAMKGKADPQLVQQYLRERLHD